MTLKWYDWDAIAASKDGLQPTVADLGLTGGNAAIGVTQGTMVLDKDKVLPAAFNQASNLLIGASGSGSDYAQETFSSSSQLNVTVGVDLATLTSTGGLAIVWAGVDGTTRGFTVGLYIDGKVAIQDSANTVIYTSAAAVSTGFGRFKIEATAGAGTGTIRVRYYAGSSTTAAQDSGVLTGRQLGASFGAFRAGKAATGAYSGTFSVFALGYSTAGENMDFPPAPSVGSPPTGLAAVIDESIASILLSATPVNPDTAVTFAITPPGSAPVPVARGGGFYTVARDPKTNFAYAYTATGNVSGKTTAAGSFTVHSLAVAQATAGQIEEIIYDPATGWN